MELLRNWKNSNSKEANDEYDTLKLADGIISQNDQMKKWLEKKEITCPIVNLGIFDYYNKHPMLNVVNNKTLSFAGNLKKSTFLKNLNLNHKLKVYGSNASDEFGSSIGGVVPPDDLPRRLNESFGIVWDGPSTDICEGNYGEYLRWNDPHKVSLYLSAGIPVII